MTKESFIPNHIIGNQFLSKKAGSFSGVPQRTVQYWTERGLVIPDIADTTGTGSKRLYSVLNCIEIGIINSLTESRFHLKFIKKIMTYLRSEIYPEIEGFKNDAVIEWGEPFNCLLPLFIILEYCYLTVIADHGKTKYQLILPYRAGGDPTKASSPRHREFIRISNQVYDQLENPEHFKLFQIGRIMHGHIHGYDKMIIVNIKNIAQKVIKEMV